MRTQRHKPGKQGITETMLKTRSLLSVIDGLLRNWRYRFEKGQPRLCNHQEDRNKRNIQIWDMRMGYVGQCQTYGIFREGVWGGTKRDWT